MKSKILSICISLAAILLLPASGYSQNSAPAPGTGGSFNPAPVGGPGPCYGGPPAPMGYMGPGCNSWGPGWNSYPVYAPNWQNYGTMNVIACGYDAQGIWRRIPLRVSYQYNGVQYNVTVLNAWNPWTGVWNIGVDMPAYNTSYYINGNNYDFYAPLSTGTYYFNL